jgi:hypothetical protein
MSLSLRVGSALIAVLASGCGREGEHASEVNDMPAATAPRHHPKVDLESWIRLFPIEAFEKKEGRRRFDTTEPGDPLDLWKASGSIVTSPADLCVTELVRRRVAQKHDLGPAVPVDVFLWRAGAPDQPYLTKLGGLPHREAAKPWPGLADNKPFTFVAQFCFIDSRDIVTPKIPGDVMLIFFRDAQSHFGDRDDVVIEWSGLELDRPCRAEDCPKPSFPVPELSGVIYRCNEFPESGDAFEAEGHYQYWLFPRTQSTKIGRETHFIQNDPREDGGELLCALNSIEPNRRWPFTNIEQIPVGEEPDNFAARSKAEFYEWGKYHMTFGDVGCMYFLIDEEGNVRWTADCY